MPNLRIDADITGDGQPVKDDNGNASPLSISLSKLGVGRVDPPSLLSLDEAGKGPEVLLSLRRQEKLPLDAATDASMLVSFVLDATGHVFTLDVGGNKNSTARIHLGDPSRATNHVTTLGNVGIGTTTPTERLEVDGNVLVSGDVALAGADCAEEFEVAWEGAEPAPGSVMAIGDDGRLRPSVSAYDTRVAGIVSGAGSLRPGVILGRTSKGSSRVPIALMGRVFCMVDAEDGEIGVGDLLTSSTTPGHAMRASDKARAVGAVIGKALAPVGSGRSLIPVLVALQ